MRIWIIFQAVMALGLLVAADFTVPYPAYYSIPIGFALGGLGASAYLGQRR